MSVVTSEARPLIEAHRGASGRFPENTMAAFRAAVDSGADSIELDVHQTADGEWVVMHDPRVDRTTDGRGLIAEMRLDAIRALDCGSWKDPAFRGEQVPTLADVVRFASAHSIALNVEIKAFADHASGPASFVSLIQGGADAHTAHVVSSFDLAALLRVRDAAPDIPLAMLGDGPKAFELCLKHGLPWLHAQAKTLTPDLVTQAHSQQIRVMAWTVDCPKLCSTLATWQVDKICTNCPAAMLAL